MAPLKSGRFKLVDLVRTLPAKPVGVNYWVVVVGETLVLALPAYQAP